MSFNWPDEPMTFEEAQDFAMHIIAERKKRVMPKHYVARLNEIVDGHIGAGVEDERIRSLKRDLTTLEATQHGWAEAARAFADDEIMLRDLLNEYNQCAHAHDRPELRKQLEAFLSDELPPMVFCQEKNGEFTLGVDHRGIDHEEADKDLIKTDTIPSYVLHVNDHGNITLYAVTTEEVWSRV